MPLQKLELPKRKKKAALQKFSEPPSPLELEPLKKDCVHQFLLPAPKGDWIVAKCTLCGGERVNAAHFGSAQAISGIEPGSNRIPNEDADRIVASLQLEIESAPDRQRLRIDFSKQIEKGSITGSKKSSSKSTSRNRKSKRKYKILPAQGAGKLQLPTLKKL